MSPFGNTGLPWVIISLGILGVILSFLVVDRRKSLISLGLAAFIILVGLIQFGSQSFTRFQWNRRMRDIQRNQQTDLDDIRQRMKDKADATQPTGAAPKKP